MVTIGNLLNDSSGSSVECYALAKDWYSTFRALSDFRLGKQQFKTSAAVTMAVDASIKWLPIAGIKPLETDGALHGGLFLVIYYIVTFIALPHWFAISLKTERKPRLTCSDVMTKPSANFIQINPVYIQPREQPSRSPSSRWSTSAVLPVR